MRTCWQDSYIERNVEFQLEEKEAVIFFAVTVQQSSDLLRPNGEVLPYNCLLCIGGGVMLSQLCSELIPSSVLTGHP